MESKEENERWSLNSVDDVIDAVGQGLWNVPFYFISTMGYALNAAYLVEMEFIAPNSNESLCNNSLDLSEGNSTECKDEKDFNSEFNITQSREYLRTSYQMSYSLGALIGSILAATVSNRYGRQISVTYSYIFLFFLTILSVTVPVLEALIVVRFLAGVFLTLALVTSVSIGMECCTIDKRHTFGILIGISYPLTLVVISGVAYLIHDWRVLHLLMSIPVLLNLIMSNPKILKESPRWLIEKGRIAEAVEILRVAAKLNRRSYNLPDDMSDVLWKIHQTTAHDAETLHPRKTNDCDSNYSKRSSTVLFFTSKPLRTLLFVTLINPMLIGAVCIGLPLRTKIATSPYLYMAVLGIMEAPCYVIFLPVIRRFGRKYLYCVLSLITALFILILFFVQLFGYSNVWINISLSSLAYMCTGCLVMLNLLYVSELYPTSVRTFGSGLAYSMMCFGFSLPPMLEMMPDAYFDIVSLPVYTLSAFIGGLLVLLLPETNNAPLLQTVDEYIQFTKGKSVDSV